MSLYRKYRPQKFAELMGQEHIKKVLTNALVQNKIGHAYLFSGSRGIGKTTVARLLAKALNCQKNAKRIALSAKRDFEPCNDCQSCWEITNDHSLDVVEIDAASNRGIDEIRELRDKIRFAPSSSPYKIYIIDEVHMLTKEAFNALLKTLEEPPKHAIFIMATTELHKIPDTILSRTQQFDFKRANISNIKKYLSYLCQQEKIIIDEQSKELIAASSDGSFRDAASILDQISSINQEQITILQTREVLGLVEEKIIQDFWALVQDNQTKKAIELIEEIYQKGYDLTQFNQSLIEFLRKKMLEDKNYSLAKLIKRFIEAGQDLKYAVVPQIPLELAVIESCNKVAQEHKNIKTKEQVKVENKNKEENSKIDHSTGSGRPEESRTGEILNSKQIPIRQLADKSQVTNNPEIQNSKFETNHKSEIINHKSSIDNLQSQWLEVVETVGRENHSLGLLLKESQPLKIEDEKLHLEVKFKFYAERIMAKDKYVILTEVIEKVFKDKMGVECVVEDKIKIKNEKLKTNEENIVNNKLITDALEVFG